VLRSADASVAGGAPLEPPVEGWGGAIKLEQFYQYIYYYYYNLFNLRIPRSGDASGASAAPLEPPVDRWGGKGCNKR